jgi:hypothetical protein
MNSTEQIKLINDTINKTRENLKPLSFNLIFWGLFINVMSIIHYFFPSFIEQTDYSSSIYWISLPVLGMIYMTRWNIKIGKKQGYETIMGRTIRIIWTVFGFGWLLIVLSSIRLEFHPVPMILFLLGLVITMTGMIIKFKPLTIGGMVLFVFVFNLLLDPDQNYLIVNMIGVTLGLLIPGIFLNRMKTNE